VAGQEGLKQGAHVCLLGLVQEHSRLKEQTHSFVSGQPRLVTEHQSVRANGQGDGQAPKGPEGGLGGARLVTAQLGDVHPGTLGEADLGEAGLAP
jgi:hypothetical protein